MFHIAVQLPSAGHGHLSCFSDMGMGPPHQYRGVEHDCGRGSISERWDQLEEQWHSMSAGSGMHVRAIASCKCSRGLSRTYQNHRERAAASTRDCGCNAKACTGFREHDREPCSLPLLNHSARSLHSRLCLAFSAMDADLQNSGETFGASKPCTITVTQPSMYSQLVLSVRKSSVRGSNM
jgi:hypothetical protein